MFKNKEENYGYAVPRRSPPPLLRKNPSFTTALDDVKPIYMSLDKVENRAKAFEKEQRERYRSYLAFLIAKLKKINVRTVVNIFMFECNMLAREISVITREPPMHFARILNTLDGKPQAALPHGYDLFFYLDRKFAESFCDQNIENWNAIGGIGRHQRDLPVYTFKTYTVDVVPFNHKKGLRLNTSFFEREERRGEYKVDDPRPFWIRGFLTIRRLAAQIHEKEHDRLNK